MQEQKQSVDTEEFKKQLDVNCPISGLPVWETFNRYTTEDPENSVRINKVRSGRPISNEEAIELIKSYNGKEGRIGKLSGFVNKLVNIMKPF